MPLSHTTPQAASSRTPVHTLSLALLPTCGRSEGATRMDGGMRSVLLKLIPEQRS